jgi:DNA-binding GntR family transcriptional regulator
MRSITPPTSSTPGGPGTPLQGAAGPAEGLPRAERPPTLRQHAVERIRDAIITGALEPGERIVEEDLAHRLGISRGPVREAIRVLEQEGFIRSEPHRASYVASLGEEEIEHLYAVRAEVEAIAARKVAGLIRQAPERAAPYDDLLARLRSAAARGDLDELTRADLDFHARLLRDSGYQVLPRVWRAMDGVVRARTAAILAQRGRGQAGPTGPGRRIVAYTAESHAPIAAALAAGDPEGAAAAVRRHILETRDLWHT